MDKNKDGKVTLEEMMEEFSGADAKLTELAKAKFAAADKNKDGGLDKEEIALWGHAPADPDVLKVVVAANIKAHDKDGDGKLDSNELNEGVNDGVFSCQPAEIAKLDADGDGKLSEEELHRCESGDHHVHSAFQALFTNADTDKDSHLSMDELQKHMQETPHHSATSQMNSWIHYHEL